MMGIMEFKSVSSEVFLPGSDSAGVVQVGAGLLFLDLATWQAASQRWRVASNDSVGGLLTLGQPASGGHHVPSHSRHPGDQSRVEAEARGASRPPSRGHQAEAAALLLISSTTSSTSSSTSPLHISSAHPSLSPYRRCSSHCPP